MCGNVIHVWDPDDNSCPHLGMKGKQVFFHCDVPRWLLGKFSSKHSL